MTTEVNSPMNLKISNSNLNLDLNELLFVVSLNIKKKIKSMFFLV